MRCFVALDLPVPVCNHLANVVRPLHGKYDVRWVEPRHMHATLLFAGDVDGGTVDALADVVHEVALPPLTMRLASTGWFPPRGIPRVLWAGLDGDVEAVTDLFEDLAAEADELGIDPDRRDFTPHITLGRVKSAFGALALLDEMRRLGATMRDKPFAIEALTLYTSELRPSGPVYEVVTRRACPTGSGAAD